MFTGILYTHIFYALGGSEMPNGQNLRPIAVQGLAVWRGAQALRFCRSLALSRSFAVRRPADPADPPDPADAAAFTLIFKRWCEKLQKSV